MHRIGCEYLMPAVMIAFPFIKVYSWTKIYRPPSLGGIFLFLGRCARGQVRSGAGVRECRAREGRVREGEGKPRSVARGARGGAKRERDGRSEQLA